VSTEGVPSAAELEARHAHVRHIEVVVENIFDPADPREAAWFYRAANHLHLKTRAGIVRDQLLFHEGDELRLGQLAESERILRTRVYFSEAWVVVTGYDPLTNSADIAVTVRDVWTLSPDVSFSRTGGSNRNRFDIQEENFLGTGTGVELAHLNNIDRSSTVLSLVNPALLAAHWSFAASYADNSDGIVKNLELGHPFYSLDSHSGFDFIALDGTSRVSRYDEGVIYDQFDEHQRSIQSYYGWSRGLIDGWTTRYYAGLRYDNALFSKDPTTLMPAELLPPERRIGYPYLAYERDEDRYAKVENQDKIGRTEDLYFGHSLYLELGAASRNLGADRSALIPRFTASAGYEFPGQRLFLASSGSGRYEDGRLDNGILNASSRYYWLQSSHELLYVSLAGTATRRLDPENQVLLGGDTGLRGYPLRFQTGSAYALSTVEERFYSDWYPLRLVRVGAAVFFDAGRTFGRGVIGEAPLGLLRDAGVGLRLGNPRSGLGSVLHVDVSWALDNTLGARRVQLTVQTLQTY
jgi:hypothetical protein